MLETLPNPFGAAPEAPRQRPNLEDLRARVAAVGSRLASPASRDAAIVLLASAQLSHNVDRLARFTRVSREQVARFARRLVDNGVWRDGHTIGRWVDNPGDVDSFVADVAVADGTLCRRMDESGELEWAPQGYWRKHYEYAGPRGQEQPQVVQYHPHVEMLSQDLPSPFEFEEEDVEGEVPSVEATVDRRTPPATPAPDSVSPPVWLGEEQVDTDGETGQTVPSMGGADLFPGADWLL